MAKFSFTVTETYDRTATYTLNLTKKEVVEGANLDPEDDWEGQVEDYIADNWEDKYRALAKSNGEADEEMTGFEIRDVEKED